MQLFMAFILKVFPYEYQEYYRFKINEIFII